MLSLSEAAKTAGVSKSTIWRACKAGRVSFKRNDTGEFQIDAIACFRSTQYLELDFFSHWSAGRFFLPTNFSTWAGLFSFCTKISWSAKRRCPSRPRST